MVRIRFLGHAAFEIEGEGKKILIDPFLTGNPTAAAKPEEFEKVDLILVTHAHGDHVGDSVKIAQRTGAKIVAMYDIANYLVEGNAGITTIGMNYGPTKVDGVKLVQVPAWHSSSDGKYSIGNACGYIVEFEGVKIYHAGDTYVFKDMELFAELYGIDVALLPIGGHFTMGPKEAAKAVELLRPKYVIPMHYRTFPPIAKTPEEFKDLVGDKAQVIILKPGEVFEL
ncbi:metal-dependent hydrolase [Thermococcus sp. MV5]|uniref:metal-dependent hydrolase n=1 Tax=Thermococcus sp. MV5 TaxID=1638272 RepID=UPI001438B051|nr:metal-dependent hydrolase [Thermococcus sp. MV5]NJE25521.1 metal-dependent hydrolase [Thermococcus sp. MV5]